MIKNIIFQNNNNRTIGPMIQYFPDTWYFVYLWTPLIKASKEEGCQSEKEAAHSRRKKKLELILPTTFCFSPFQLKFLLPAIKAIKHISTMTLLTTVPWLHF